MLKTRNIAAYRDLLVLFTKYGRKDFRLSLAPEQEYVVPTLPLNDALELFVARARQLAAKPLREILSIFPGHAHSQAQ